MKIVVKFGNLDMMKEVEFLQRAHLRKEELDNVKIKICDHKEGFT